MTLDCGDVKSDLPFSYYWKLHDNLIDGEYLRKLTVNTSSVSSSGVYTCLVTTVVGQTSGPGIVMEIYEPPNIISEPDDATYLLPIDFGNVTFICEISGWPCPNISWFYTDLENTFLLSGKYESELILNNINASNGGYYYCKANNSHGTVTSRFATLDVLRIEFPKQFIEMSIDIVSIHINKTEGFNKNDKLSELKNSFNSSRDDETTTKHRAKDNRNYLYKGFAEQLRNSIYQNISFFTTNKKEQNVTTLHFTILSIFNLSLHENAVPRKILLRISKQSRQDLANSASKLVNLIFLNKSTIYVQDSIIVVDNTSLTYKATLDECQSGYQLDKNGIFCGKF